MTTDTQAGSRFNTLAAAFEASKLKLPTYPNMGHGAAWFGDIGGGDVPAGPLLQHLQGEHDLALARSLAESLARSILRRTGKETGRATVDDAVGDAVLALAEWRAGAVVVPVKEAGGKRRPNSEAAGVAWRAIVASFTADNMGETVDVHTVGDEWLYHNADQANETRAERAHRLRIERARAMQRATVDGQVLDAYGRGRGNNKRQRGRVCVRVRRALRLLVAGERLEAAALAAGFTGSGTGRGKFSPGDALLRAVKRLGFNLGVLRRGVHATGPRAKVNRHAVSVDGTGEHLGFAVDESGACAEVTDGGKVPGFVPFKAGRWSHAAGESVVHVHATIAPAASVTAASYKAAKRADRRKGRERARAGGHPVKPVAVVTNPRAELDAWLFQRRTLNGDRGAGFGCAAGCQCAACRGAGTYPDGSRLDWKQGELALGSGVIVRPWAAW